MARPKGSQPHLLPWCKYRDLTRRDHAHMKADHPYAYDALKDLVSKAPPAARIWICTTDWHGRELDASPIEPTGHGWLVRRDGGIVRVCHRF